MTDKQFDALNITMPGEEPEIETMRETCLKFRRDGELTLQLEMYLTAKELVELISLLIDGTCEEHMPFYSHDEIVAEMRAINDEWVQERTCECGWHGFVDGWGYDPPNYCPNCGAKVVG